MTSATSEQISKADREAPARSAPPAEQIAKDGIGHLVKGRHVAERVAESAADALAETGEAADRIAKGQIEALAESGSSAMAGFQQLVQAYQSLAAKNAERLSASMKAIVAARTVPEFVDIQQKLATGAVEETVKDYLHIAELTAAFFTASFEPLKRQVATLHRTTAH